VVQNEYSTSQKLYKNELFDFSAGSAGFQPAGEANSGLEARAPREFCLKINSGFFDGLSDASTTA
jgi:hypothetical protein